MAGAIETAEQLLDFLGADNDDANLALVERLRASAIEDICRATGVDWCSREKVGVFNEALRTRVWLSFYAIRDGTKNTQFLQEHLTGLMCALQLCGGEGA